MRAAVYYEPGDIRIEDVPEPSPGRDEVKVKVAFNGICGSDLHEYYGHAMMVPLGYRHPLTGVQAPVILGHEAAGTVVEIGPGVQGIEEGQLVAIEPIVACKTCMHCENGSYNHCTQMAFHGYSTGGGGLAEYTVVGSDMVHVIPAGITSQQAALVEPMAVAWHALKLANLKPGDYCVIFGAGPIGLGAYFGARAMDVHPIIVEVSEHRRAAARQIGAAVVNPADGGVYEQVLEITGGRSAAACIDAAGVAATLENALGVVGVHGCVVIVGVPDGRLPLTAGLMFMTEASLVASRAYCNDFPEVIEGVRRGDYPLDGWVKTIGMEQLVEEGFEALRQGREIKVLVDPAR
jgi:(R,R)-butanediol dehydrogenase/meso-butanediol dehydrogenase/diacetyl reductase